jgi:DNA-binding CsgD family transcriptional regulator
MFIVCGRGNLAPTLTKINKFLIEEKLCLAPSIHYPGHGSPYWNTCIWNNSPGTIFPPVVFTDFKIANKPVFIGENSPLKKHISEAEKIILSYRDNIFSFEFAALDYTNPGKNQYMYKLEGFNRDWIHLGHKHDMTFTNLDPGEYTLRIKGSNNDSIWENEGTSIKIIIIPPFWRTWWFRVLLILAVVALAFLWHRSRMKLLTLKLKTETEMGRILSKYNISPREQEIIRLILIGKTNKDIEDELFISLSTVKSHIYSAYQKLKVKNRLELIHLIQKSVGQ